MLTKPTFSFNDAYRVISNVIDERIRNLTSSGAGIEVTWGTVASLDGEAQCSVYLFGDTIPSSGFRLENGLKPNLLDPVRVSIDKRGNRWVDAILNDSTTDFPKLEIDPRLGEIRTGDGTVEPTPLDEQFSDSVHDHDADYADIGHTHNTIAGFGRLRFVPISRVTVFSSATTSATISRTLTSAISGIPASAKVISGYMTLWADSANVSNLMTLYHTEAGSNDIGAFLQAGSTTVHNRLSTGFHVGAVQSSGAKISYSINRSAGTLTYDLFVTGYWTDDV